MVRLRVFSPAELRARQTVKFFGSFDPFSWLSYLTIDVCFNSKMSDYPSMATLQNNSQTAGYVDALQRAKLVSQLCSHNFATTSLVYR